MLRDRSSLIVAALSAVMWLGIGRVLAGVGPLTWIVAVLLLVGGVWAHVGQDSTPDAERPGDQPADPGWRKDRKKGRGSIYGPPQ